MTDSPLVPTLPNPLVLPLHCHVEGEVVHVSPGGLIWFTSATLSLSLNKLMDRLAMAILSPTPNDQGHCGHGLHTQQVLSGWGALLGQGG